MPGSLPAADEFARSGSIELLGRQVACPGPLDMVLIAAVHGATHLWDRLEDVVCVTSCLDRLKPEEWEALEELARGAGCRRRLHVAIRLAVDVLGQGVPDRVARPLMRDGLAGRPGARAWG